MIKAILIYLLFLITVILLIKSWKRFKEIIEEIRLKLKLERFNKEERNFTEAIELNPKNAEAYFLRGEFYRKKRTCLKKLLKIIQRL